MNRSAVKLARRQCMQTMLAGLAGMTLPAGARAGSAETPRAKACLLLYMDGGPSHIDLFDMKPGAPSEIRGPWQPIATTVPGIEIGELLPMTARQMHRVALIRSMRHEIPVHDPAVYEMLTGFKHNNSIGALVVDPTDAPCIGAAFGRADRTPTTMPKVVHMPELMNLDGRILPGQHGGRLGGIHNPFLVDITVDGTVRIPPVQPHVDLTLERIRQRKELWEQLGRFPTAPLTQAMLRARDFQRQSLDIISNPRVEQAFDLTRESDDLRERYGRNRHGQSVLLARRLIEGGAKFVTVYWGREPQDMGEERGVVPANNPWDTHRNHFPLVKESLAPRADRAFATLLQDLEQRGLLDETLVVWMGDFGRTPRISPWASRDHWPHAFSLMMAGGGIRGGTLWGKTDGRAEFITDDPVSPADLTATIFDRLGVAPKTIVPDAYGRPHRLSDGTPLTAIYG